MTSTDCSPGAAALLQARRQDVARRRQRVHRALAELRTEATEVTVSSVARRAGVHRSFLHRHPDLRAAVLAAADGETAGDIPSSTASRRSLLADSTNLREQNRRLAQQIRALEDRLAGLLGEAAFQRSGLGAPTDTAALQARIGELDQQVLDLRRLLEERDEELAAARDANRRLIAELNRPST
ncbi:DUF6262 family protein [Parafrankia sp. FMc6]|uniref:DUF6262 family protein n=1 Tax=Parafrankia soli TaxID=2599596 RepID=UPI0034D63FA4